MEDFFENLQAFIPALIWIVFVVIAIKSKKLKQNQGQKPEFKPEIKPVIKAVPKEKPKEAPKPFAENFKNPKRWIPEVNRTGAISALQEEAILKSKSKKSDSYDALRKVLQEDRKNDWMAKQIAAENAVFHRGGMLSDLGAAHEKDCAAKALKEEHSHHCDAREIDQPER